MKLATKLTLTLGVSALVVLAGKAVVDVDRERALLDSESFREERQLGTLLGAAIAEVWQAEGESRALELVGSAHAAKDDVEVRWVWLEGDAEERFRPRLPMSDLSGLLEGKNLSRKIDTPNGIGAFLSYTPVETKGPRRGALEITKSLEEETQFLRGSWTATAFATAILLALFIGMSAGFSTLFISRPVSALVEQLRRISAGDLTRDVTSRRHDELALLALEMNEMTNQLRHTDRLTTVGTVAAGIAHELGTPLHVVTSSAEAIVQDDLGPGEVKENAQLIAEQSRRMAEIIRNLLDFARRREPQRESYDVRHVVTQAVTLLQPALTARAVRVAMDLTAAPCFALLDLTQVQQAVTNLLVNAMHVSSRDGVIQVSVRPLRRAPPTPVGAALDDFVCIAVSDAGPGMTEDVKRRVFQPFFTTKPVGEGTGLGLPISYSIVQEHQGFMEVETTLGRGSRFSIHLPAKAE